METKKRKIYSREFKQEAVCLVRESGRSLAAIARDLGIDQNSLHKWKRAEEQYGAQVFPGQGRSHDEDLARLAARSRALASGARYFSKGRSYFASAPR